MNVKQLRDLIAHYPDDAPVILRESAPCSERPDSFEDEYGPGTIDFDVGMLPCVHAGTPSVLTLSKMGQREPVAVAVETGS